MPPPPPTPSVDVVDDACYTNAHSSPATLAHAVCWVLEARTLLDQPLLAGCTGGKGGNNEGGTGGGGTATATKWAMAMAMRVVGKDAGNYKGGKSNGDGAKRAIARKRAMASKDNNKITATETMTQHCCRHHCPCLSCHGSSLCFGVLAAAGSDWWRSMRTKVGAWGGGELCMEV